MYFFFCILKGFYLYYFDKVFLVWKLEINWRFLEEYFFSVGIVDVLDFDVFVVLEDVFVYDFDVEEVFFWGFLVNF